VLHFKKYKLKEIKKPFKSNFLRGYSNSFVRKQKNPHFCGFSIF